MAPKAGKCGSCGWQVNAIRLRAFFQRLQVRRNEGILRRNETVRTYNGRDPELEWSFWPARDGELTKPGGGAPVKPWLPLAGFVEVPERTDRRQVLADWLCRPNNPYFARVEVNRVWKYLF